MLCQNCRKNEATTHIKQIRNGVAAEYHLCRSCAESLGYSAPFTGTGLGELFSSFLGDMLVSRLSNTVLRCEKCGCTFEDIVNSGKVGCADCYALFYDKLLPSVQRIHGQTRHVGKIPSGTGENIKLESRIAQTKEKLNRAIDDQNFELAALLRDEIRQLEAARNG